MKRITMYLAGLILIISASCKEAVREEAPLQETMSTTNLVEKGEYLVTVIGCADCHTPKKMTETGPMPDMERYMMGYDASQPFPEVPENVPLGPWIVFNGELTAAAGPWGVSFAGNLTPHASGIGNWTLEQFSRAMREGKYKGLENSRPIMPPMPVQGYAQLTDEDLEAIFRYLKSIQPIENVVPAYRPPAP